MKKLNTIKWGIIGVGDVCEKKSAPALYKSPNSEVLIVMRRNGEKAADFANRHGIAQWTSNAEEVLTHPEVNAIYIATPPNSHKEYAIRAAQVGKPVYVEKPMAMDFAECKEMVQACNTADVPLFVAYYRRALPNIVKVKELLEEGHIGAVRMVRIDLYQPIQDGIIVKTEENWRVNPMISGGGYFHDLASHQFDLLDFLLGPISSATGIGANQVGVYPADDVVSAAFQFQNGIMGSGSWCFTANPVAEKDAIVLIGEKGKIKFGVFADTTVKLKTPDQELEFKFDMPEHIQMPLIQHILADLRGEAESPSTGQTAARTNWVLDAITGS